MKKNVVTDLVPLLQRCAEKDRPAFSDLYRLTFSKLFTLTKRIVKDEDIARDVLQKSYITIWNKAAHFDPDKGRPMTWMLVIVRNTAIDEWRRIRRHSQDAVIDDTLADSSALPDERTELVLVRNTLIAELARLPERMADVIRRRFLLNQPASEIANELSIPLNTVRSWIRRGLELLRNALPYDSAHVAIFVR